MTTIKSYTDISQSKKLAEILPIESADMHYATWTILDGEFIVSPNQGSTIEDLQEDYGNQIIPCWSLAALLNVIPYTIYKSDNEFYRLGIDKGYDDYAVWYNNNGFTITDLDVASDNFVDACYEMIVKLYEQKLL